MEWPLYLVLFFGGLIALLLTRAFFGRAVVRAVILLPWALPGAITAVLWVWVFNPSWGVLNGLLRRLGLIEGSIPWLTDPTLAFASVAVAHIWSQIPFSVVLVMAAEKAYALGYRPLVAVRSYAVAAVDPG